jgi:PAS domain S-box-containing protein
VSFIAAFMSSSSGRSSECSTTPAPNVGWGSLVGVVFLALVGLTGFAIVKHLLFPTLGVWEYQAITIGAGAVAAGVSAYYVMRRMARLVAMHTHVEASLVLERNVLRTVTDNIRDSIFAKDSAGRYLLANKAFANLHGVESSGELIGKTAFDLFSEERATASFADDLKVMRTGGAVLERERSTVDSEGNEGWVLTTKVPLISKDGMIQGIVGVHRDITRSKQAEQRLRESQASLAVAQRIAHLGSFEVGPIDLKNFEDCPLRWSDEVFRNYGYEFDGTEHSVSNLLRLIHPDDRGRVIEGFLKTIQETTPYEADFRIVRGDGTERFVRGWCEVVCDSSTQQPSKLVGSIQDVTDRKQAELGLQEANRKLAEQVQELQRRSSELALLSAMGSWLQSCRVVDEAYVVIGKSAKRLFPAWDGALYVMSASRSALETVVDWNECSSSERVFGPEECWALRRGQVHWFSAGGDATPCSHINRKGVARSLCVPLMAQGEALGTLHLQQAIAQRKLHDSESSPVDAEQGLAVVLAEQVALALGNLKLRETLRNQSIRDPLTSLFNRRYLEESLEREISRAKRNGSSVAI